MLLTPLGPEKIKDEATNDIEGLLVVGETLDMVPLKARWVVFAFEDSFT